MAMLDIVEFMDPTGRELVHRVPQAGSGEFKLGSQCIVRESQVAVFFRDGKALDVLGPGRHTLSTQNIPVLTGLLSIPFGGRTPFKAEVYFVNMADIIDLKWGTSEPVVFRDTELGMVRLRAFGTYSMTVADPQLFVNKIVGTQGIVDSTQIGDYLRGIIVSRLNVTLGQTMSTLLDLAAKYTTLAAALKASVADDFANIGVQLKQFFITSITPPEEVQKMIDQRSSMGALGDMNRYMQFQAAQAMGNMGQGGGGSDVAATGIGLGAGAGLGMGMAQMIGQAFQQPQQQQQQAPQQQQASQGSTASVTPATAGPASASQATLITCPGCHAQIPEGSKFCPECGYNMMTKPTCPTCQAEVAPGQKFCPNCGQKLA